MVALNPANFADPPPSAPAFRQGPAVDPASSPAPSSPPPAPPSFLSALLSSNFDFAALTRTLTPDQLLALIHDDALRNHLSALAAFTNACLELKHAQARAVAIEALADVARTTDDPVEKRRAATALLRATGAPHSGHPSPHAAPSDADPHADPYADPDSEDPDSARGPALPAVLPSPSPELTVEAIRDLLCAALARNDLPEPDTGLATVAAFLTDDATIDGRAIPGDDPDYAVDVLAGTELAECLPPAAGRVGVAPRIAPDHLAASANLIYRGPARDAPTRELTLHLTRRALADPWLIHRLTITRSPPNLESEPMASTSCR